MRILLSFLPIFVFLNESVDLISSSNQIEFRGIVSNQRNTNTLAKPFAFRKMVKNLTNASQRDQKFNNNCAWSKEPLTYQHLTQVCGLRLNNPQFPSNNYVDIKRAAKIVNGRRAQLGEWPWQAFLVVPHNRSKVIKNCGGVLITDNVILTAAHCLPVEEVPASRIQIMLGAISRVEVQQYRIVIAALRYKIHENYVLQTLDNDLGLIWLQKKVQFNCFIAPVCLPFPPEPFLGNRLDQVKVWVAGYGHLHFNGTTAEHMMQVQLTVLSHQQCINAYAGRFVPFSLSRVICTYGGMTGICQADSGGPVVIRYRGRWTTVGIVSFTVNKCAISPSGNVRVASYIDWINQNVGMFD